MISLDEVNEEWKKQDARLDAFRSKAKVMHEALIKEVEGLNYDIYKREESEIHDSLPVISKSLVQSDAMLRTVIKGPTLIKEKFHPSYWKHFNTERDLLEEMSRQQFLKMEKRQEQQETQRLKKTGTHGKLSMGKNSTTEGKATLKGSQASSGHKLASSKSYNIFKGDYIDHNWKATVFASPIHLKNDLDESPYFDSHLLGKNNSIEHLLQQTTRKTATSRSPERSQTMASSKKRQEKKQVENSIFDPNAIGNTTVKGGDFPKGSQRPKTVEPVTKLCDIPNLADTLKTVKGGVFLQEPRFPSSTSNFPSSSGATSIIPSPSRTLTHNTSNNTFKFSLEKRFPTKEEETSKNLLATPGPANYSVSRLFDVDPKQKRKDFEAIYEKYKDEPRGLSALTTHELSLLAIMGQHCNLEEHIRYGRCNHPLCCRQTEWDKMVLRSNDLQRVAGIEKAESLGYTSTLKTRKLQTQSSNRLSLSREITPLLPTPQFHLLALYTAAYKNDIPAIRHLCSLHVDPNDFNEENGYAALHIAVAQNNEEAVNELLICFEGVIDVNLPEQAYGNTPLHIACQKRLKKIVMILCDDLTCDPEKYRNRQGEYAYDVCFIQNTKHNNNLISHEIWQIIDVTRERNRLRKQLDELTVKEKKKKIWER